MSKIISWDDFSQVEIRVGTVRTVEPFPEARKPTYKLTVDFGPEIGTLKSSAQITAHYQPADLIGKQVMGVVNFPKKQIGPFVSECLISGFYREDGSVILAVPDKAVADGAKLG
jgi:tRNA-binding protein